MLNIISAEDNKKIKFIKSLKQKKIRNRELTYILEGIKPITEAIIENKEIVEIFMSSSFYDNIFPDYRDNFENIKFNTVSDQIFLKITDTVNSQGIIATMKMRFFSLEEIVPYGRYILLDGLSDPGNMGGIIRGADAFSFDGIIIGPNSVDVLNEKVVRSSMASIFRVQLYQMKDYKEMDILKDKKFRIFATSVEGGSLTPKEADLRDNFVIVIGNEANGMSQEATSRSAFSIHIPMTGRAQSLNANVSASILMYESGRQRS